MDIKNRWSAYGSKPAFLMLIVFLLGTYLFFPTLGYDFLWDDRLYVKENLPLESFASLPQFFTSDLSLGGHTGFYRPLFMVSLSLDYALFKKNPWGYHLSNSIIHGINSSLVTYLALLLLENPYGALIAGALFALHPAHLEPVAFISARADLWFTLFSLLMMIALIKNPRGKTPWGPWLWAPLFFLLALLSKETAVVVLIPLALWLYPQNPHLPQKRRGLILKFLPSGLMLILYLLLRSWALNTFNGSKIKLSLYTPCSFLFELSFRYLSFLIFPSQRVSYFYDPRNPYRSSHPLDAKFWFFVGVIILFLSVVTYLIYRWRATAPFFALLILPCLPSLYYSLHNINIMVERYLYLPSVGLALLAGWSFLQIPEKRKKWAWMGIAIILLAYGGVTLWRAPLWKNEEVFFQALKKEYPASPYVRTWLGSLYQEQNRLPEASPELSMAVKLEPKNPFYRNNLGWVLLEQGQTAEARAEFAEALRLWPQNASALGGMGLTYRREGNKAKALEYLEQALLIDPKNENFQRNKERILAEGKSSPAP